MKNNDSKKGYLEKVKPKVIRWPKYILKDVNLWLKQNPQYNQKGLILYTMQKMGVNIKTDDILPKNQKNINFLKRNEDFDFSSIDPKNIDLWLEDNPTFSRKRLTLILMKNAGVDVQEQEEIKDDPIQKAKIETTTLYFRVKEDINNSIIEWLDHHPEHTMTSMSLNGLNKIIPNIIKEIDLMPKTVGRKRKLKV